MFIRFQSNGIPKNCYMTNFDSQKYPVTANIDFEVTWNKSVFNKFNIGYDYPKVG